MMSHDKVHCTLHIANARCLVHSARMQCMFHISRKQIEYKIHHANCMIHPENIFFPFQSYIIRWLSELFALPWYAASSFQINFTFFSESNQQNRVPSQPNTAFLIQVVQMLIINFILTVCSVFYEFWKEDAFVIHIYLVLSVSERDRERKRVSSLYGSRNSKLIDSHQF